MVTQRDVTPEEVVIHNCLGSRYRRKRASGAYTMFTSFPRLGWHYPYWQRQTAGYLRTFDKNKLPNNEMIGYVINDKHPKSIRVHDLVAASTPPPCLAKASARVVSNTFELCMLVKVGLHTKVACDRYMWVTRYKKAFRYQKKIWAHDEHSECRLGDVVRVQPLGYRVGPWKTYVLVRTTLESLAPLLAPWHLVVTCQTHTRYTSNSLLLGQKCEHKIGPCFALYMQQRRHDVTNEEVFPLRV
eukprot:5139923-Amphidinium_carterae.1